LTVDIIVRIDSDASYAKQQENGLCSSPANHYWNHPIFQAIGPITSQPISTYGCVAELCPTLPIYQKPSGQAVLPWVLYGEITP
jgi:hypothetical protein